MTEKRITNVHVHTFTEKHIPPNFPNWFLRVFRSYPGLAYGPAALLRFLGFVEQAAALDRLIRMGEESQVWEQEKVLASLRPQYPSGTRFVVLPMDMAGIGFGAPKVGLRAQHDELARLAADNPDTVIPFATINPANCCSALRALTPAEEMRLRWRQERHRFGFPDYRPGLRYTPACTAACNAGREMPVLELDATRACGLREFRRAIDTLGFRGLKLYPRLGFPPDHPVLMEEVYPLLQERGLPVMSHCSRGGMQGRDVVDAVADRYTDPAAFIPVLEAFPDLRVCLAHFGGEADWRSYVVDGIDPDDPGAEARNWQVAIRRMIGSGRYGNLWTDISYTIFHFEDYIPFLRLFLQGEGEAGERLRSRVLFGSDYFMTRQEALSERAVCFRLRNALGEDLFWRISQENPEVWLGERAERSRTAAEKTPTAKVSTGRPPAGKAAKAKSASA
ncbi:MAG: amidohydrolase [Rhodobacteraceae bacterium]|nr:amidohydrolase [Paracoccaceae bacterium]